MNQTVELVKRWCDYEQQSSNPNIEDFCRIQLAVEVRKDVTKLRPDPLDIDLNGALIKTISRIGKFHEIYVNKALEGSGLNQIEEFGILISIYNLKNPIKSEAIFSNMLELSSGTNMLIRLKDRRLISEYSDSDDKRVKRLKLTVKGEKVLKHAKVQIIKVVAMLTQDLTEDDKHLCLQLLKSIDNRFTPVLHKQKNMLFAEAYTANVK